MILKVSHVMSIICWQTIYMKYHVFFGVLMRGLLMGLFAEPVFGTFGIASFKPVSTATETS